MKEPQRGDQMLTAEELRQLREIDPLSIDPDTLVDICSVKINTALPKEERIADFIRQIKNPYLFKCGDMVIQSVFADTEVTLNDCLKQYLKNV
jgi:CxxC motif-containing protein